MDFNLPARGVGEFGIPIFATAAILVVGLWIFVKARRLARIEERTSATTQADITMRPEEALILRLLTEHPEALETGRNNATILK